MHFFPQLKLKDIRNMSQMLFEFYIKSMHMIQAREQMSRMEASSYPQMKKEDKKKLHKNISKIAFPNSFKQRAVKTEDLKLV